MPVDATAFEIDYIDSGHIRIGIYQSPVTALNPQENVFKVKQPIRCILDPCAISSAQSHSHLPTPSYCTVINIGKLASKHSLSLSVLFCHERLPKILVQVYAAIFVKLYALLF